MYMPVCLFSKKINTFPYNSDVCWKYIRILFGMSDSEEEIIVAANFVDDIPQATDTTEYKIIGLDTNEPIFQYGKQVFKGQWRDVIGTKTYFGESSTPPKLDPVFQPNIPKQYECQYMTKKILHFESFVLTPKESGAKTEADEKIVSANEDDDSIDFMDIEVLPLKKEIE